MFVCSDSEYCEERRANGHAGEMLGQAKAMHYVEDTEGTRA